MNLSRDLKIIEDRLARFVVDPDIHNDAVQELRAAGKVPPWESFRGMCESDISKCESMLDVSFPEFFKGYLGKFAYKNGGLFSGSEIMNPGNVISLKEEVISWYDGIVELPIKFIVYAVHQGYTALVLVPGSDEYDCAVYEADEAGEEFRKICEGFSQLIDSEISLLERR